MGRATPSSELGASLLSLVLPRLLKSGRYAVHGFGVFTLRIRKARRIRNPVTKELMWLPASPEVRFHAAAKLRRRIRNAPQSPERPLPATIESEATR